MYKFRKGISKRNRFENLARTLTIFAGSTTAFMLALTTVLIWGISGPLFKFSMSWLLMINTGTTISTFLMVFLIQRAQNKESLALQLKLNEIIAATTGASNRLVDIENLSEEDLKLLKVQYSKLTILFEEDYDIKQEHSVEETDT
ncbi:MAG: low affinity iron permease family protein [Ignavibacteria bacterium]|nr:low affinity iron permease family protein [Ignavibacteriota bacterium]